MTAYGGFANWVASKVTYVYKRRFDEELGIGNMVLSSLTKDKTNLQPFFAKCLPHTSMSTYALLHFLATYGFRSVKLGGSDDVAVGKRAQGALHAFSSLGYYCGTSYCTPSGVLEESLAEAFRP